MKPYQVASYLRVSTDQQDFHSQSRAVESWLAQNQYRARDVLRYQDRQSGQTLGRRDIERLSRDIQSGRVTHVVFFSLDRFCRELIQGLNQLDAWGKAGVRLTFIADGIDIPAGPMCDAMLKMMVAIRLCMAESERTRIRERTRLGQLAAKARGVHCGRPRTIDAARVLSLRRDGQTAEQIARKLSISVPSVYRLIRTKKKVTTTKTTH